MRRTKESLPFSSLTMRATDESEQIFHCYDDDGKEPWLGAVFAVTSLSGADQSTVDTLISALSVPMPAGSFIQFGLMAHPHVDEPLRRYRSNKVNAEGMSKEMATRQHDLFESGLKSPLISQSAVLMNCQDLFITIKVPASLHPTAENIASAQAAATRLSEAISATKMSLRRLKVSDYIQLLRTLHDMWGAENDSFVPDIPIREQIYGPTEGLNFKEENTINFHGGRYYGKVLSVKLFPQHASLSSMARVTGDANGLSNQITDPYYMVMTIRYPDQVDTANKVKTRGAMINHQAYGPMLRLAPILGYKKQGFDVLIDEISGHGGVLCEVNFTIFLFSQDKLRLEGLSAALCAYYGSMQYKIIEDRRLLKPLWNELLPLNTTTEGIKNLYRFHTMAVKHAVQFLPILGEWCGTQGAAMVFTTRHGQPATFDLYDSEGNYNAYVCAESGAGKSFFTQGLIRDYLAEGAKVWAIDSGASYFKFNRMVGGEYIEFSNESEICMNPFTHIDDLDDEMDVLKATLAKMASPEDGLNDHQMSILEQAITSVWQKYGRNATPSAVSQWCVEQANNPEANRLATQLFPFTSGAYTRWFNGPNTLDMNKDFVVLELQDLKGRKALQQVILLQIISRINHEMFLTRGRKKILVIDEAWELLDDPMMAKALVAIYRKARKSQGAIIVVTQSVADLAKSENSKAIIDNSTWSFILKQKPESINAAVKSGAMNIDPYGAYLMKTVHTVPGAYAEVMVRRGSQYGVYRNVVDAFTNVTFSTKGAEFEQIMGEINNGVSAVDAVNNYLAMQ